MPPSLRTPPPTHHLVPYIARRRRPLLSHPLPSHSTRNTSSPIQRAAASSPVQIQRVAASSLIQIDTPALSPCRQVPPSSPPPPPPAPAILLSATPACSAYCTAASDAMVDADSSSNPLLADFDFPPFSRIEPAHEGELEELEKGVEPVWERLVHPLERIVDRLGVVWNVVDHIKVVKDSPDLRAAVEDVQPEKVKFYLRLGQSKPIYEAFNAIRNSSDWGSLSDVHKRVVEGQIRDTVLGGVALEDEQREKFNQIQQPASYARRLYHPLPPPPVRP